MIRPKILTPIGVKVFRFAICPPLFIESVLRTILFWQNCMTQCQSNHLRTGCIVAQVDSHNAARVGINYCSQPGATENFAILIYQQHIHTSMVTLPDMVAVLYRYILTSTGFNG